MKTGKIAENILKRSVLKQIKTKRQEVIGGAGIGEDCAFFTFGDGELQVSCMQEGELLLPTQMEPRGMGRGLSHLLLKCSNNIAAGGAKPIAVTIALLLPAEATEQDVKELMQQAEETCQGLSVQIAGGQTRVTEGVSVPFGVVTAYGNMPREAYERGRKAAPGQDIVISKWIGLEGTAILAKQQREKLLGRYPAYLVEEAAGFERFYSIADEAATAMKSGVCAMHDASEGGIFAALWQLAESAGVGLTIDLKKLPLRQETVEVCECCGVNPYELLSGGCLVMTGEDGEALAGALMDAGIPATVVGKITNSNDRIICNEGEIRYMDRPARDEIYKTI